VKDLYRSYIEQWDGDDDTWTIVTRRENMEYLICMNHIKDKMPFMTEKGYVGMGPGHAEVGDVVVIFAGAHIPHVIRKAPEQGPHGETHWTFVGEAYCDGVMDGEAWSVTEDMSRFHLI